MVSMNTSNRCLPENLNKNSCNPGGIALNALATGTGAMGLSMRLAPSFLKVGTNLDDIENLGVITAFNGEAIWGN